MSLNREYVGGVVAKFRKDLAERVAATAVEAGIATFLQQSFNLPLWTVPVLTTALSALKGLVAKRVGSSTTASLHPEV